MAAEITQYKKKIFQHNMRKAIIGLIILVSVLVIGFVSYQAFLTRSYEDYIVVNQVEHHTIEGSKVLGFGTKFITYSSDGIHCTDAKGTDIWSFPYEMQTPMIDINGRYVACADYNGRSVYIFNDEGTLGSIQFNVPVKNICISGTGVVAVTTDKGEVTPISMYYYDGTEIASFRTSMSKFGYPVAIGMSDDSKLVGVSYLYLDSGELTTKVAFYNFGEVGQNETDNLVSGYDYKESIVPTIGFLNNRTAYALANDRLLFFDGKERPVNKNNIMLHDQVHAIYSGDGKVGLVYLNNTGETKYKMDIYSGTGQLDTTLYFDLEYSDIFFANNRVAIYNSGSALIYTDSGTIKFNGDFKEPVSLLLPTNSDLKYVAVTQESIQTISLQ